MIPDKPLGFMPPGVVKAFEGLKRLPDTLTIWHHLAPWEKDAPDFLLLDAENRALLVKVSTEGLQQVRAAPQMLLKGIALERPPLGKPEEIVLAAFMEKLHQKSPMDITAAVLFPEVPKKILLSNRPANSDPRFEWLGQEDISPEVYDLGEQIGSCPPLGVLELEWMRAAFTPEVLVPPVLTVRKGDSRGREAGLTNFLLDYDQEAVLKADLELPESALGLSRTFGVNLVNGVAGSGKTLILLYRLRLLQGLFPDKRYLVLTHNKPLIQDLESRYHRLMHNHPGVVEWNTFMGWCSSVWPEKPSWTSPISDKRKRSMIHQVHESVLSKSTLTDRMLRGEIDWIKDRMIDTLEVYQAADRRGRGFGLNEGQREQVFLAYQAYQDHLGRIGCRDWADIPIQVLQFLQSGVLDVEPYDAVLIDEAQFFAPTWFEVVRSCLKPQIGHIFLAADPTQGFLRQGTSWKSLGFDIRGRSFSLHQSYRTTFEILDFASLFYRQRISQEADDEEVISPDLIDMPSGVLPQLIPLKSFQDETIRVVNEIVGLVNQGLPRKDLLVLHANWEGAQALIRALEQRLGRGSVFDPYDTYPGNYIRVTSINRGTGLEAPIVFLMGLHQLFEEEQSLRLSEDEREQLVRENTRRIYMAVTRAGQRLVLTYVGKLPNILSQLINISSETQS